MVHFNLRSSTVRALAEVTLAIVLFADASRVNLRALRAQAAIPARLLAIGLPLTIAAGAATAALLFGNSGLWVAAAIGAIVAPTDAALGAVIMEDARVPVAVRRTLNVESGLNDGIATPFVNLFIAGAVTADALNGTHLGDAVVQLIGGVLLGVGIGVVGATLLALARRHGWSSPEFRPLAILALALFAYSTALVAGHQWLRGRVRGRPRLRERRPSQRRGDAPLHRGGGDAACPSLCGSSSAPSCSVPGLEDVGWRDAVFAFLALTILRMVPVAIALAGAGLDRATVAFIGWFGPRGLASVVFGLLAVDALEPRQANVVLASVTLTVALSVLLHGVSASPLSARYGSYAGQHLEGHRREHSPSPTLSTRTLRHARSLLSRPKTPPQDDEPG